ncbi:MAG TPA: GtrA family protein [Hyphomonadaceae bacterium]|nr:GtrA family protein [Hyphomonadaceae bacterium]
MKQLRPLIVKLADTGGGSLFRYLVAVIIGFVIDMSSAWSVRTFLGIDLVVAAAIGFIVAMTVSYFIHEFWTFQRPASGLSLRRFMKFVAACAALFVARLVFVWATGFLGPLPGGDLARLILSFGGSMIVGFFLNRSAVFDDIPAPGKAESR